MTATIASLRAALAPTGVLRASINLGNPILANRDPVTGEPVGVSIDLARGLAEQLDLPIKLVVFDAAGKSVQAVTAEQADVGFFAVDPERGAGIAFTAPYVLIEGCYLVHDDSPLMRNDEVDAEGRTVVVGRGSAYDLHLARTLKHASIVRSPTSPTVVDTFVQQRADVAAGVKQQLQADAARLGGLRLLVGRFRVIDPAWGCPKARPVDAAAYLTRYVEEAKASGAVAAALRRHGISGASVAPLR